MADHYFLFRVAPTSKGRPRFSRKSGHTFTPLKTRQAELEIATLARCSWLSKKPLTAHLEATITFQCKRPPTSKLKYPPKDVDNMCKLVLDSLNNIVYEDDRQIVKLTANKIWGLEDKIVLVLTEI